MRQPGRSIKHVIEPFDPAKHDRAAFSCGVVQVDNFLQKTAHKLMRAGNSRVFVMVGSPSEIVGFYALNAHAVDYTDLPREFARTRPGHGSIPAAYISMIGVDRRFSGDGFGGDLLVDALTRIALAAGHMGVAVVLMDVLDCGEPHAVARRLRLYEGYGFRPLPSRPLRLFLPLATIRDMILQGLDSG